MGLQPYGPSRTSSSVGTSWSRTRKAHLTVLLFQEETKPNPDFPEVERSTINALVYNPKTNKVLCLDWEKFNWKTFIIGGVDDGEDIILAAAREIEKETGYTHVTFARNLGKIKSTYFAAHKGENRVANTDTLLFELVDDERSEVKESESKNHVFVWVPKDKVGEYVNLSSQKYIWKKALEVLG
jgi:hypothetical protein